MCNEQRLKWQLEKLPMHRTLLGFGYARRLERMVKGCCTKNALMLLTYLKNSVLPQNLPHRYT